MPGTRCSVGVCSNSLQKTKLNPDTVHIKYHSFPNDENVRKIWIQRCKRDGKWNPSSCHVCSVHFKDEDYERDLRNELLGLVQKKVLKKDAAPSLKLSKTNDDERRALAAQNRVSLSEKRERKQIVHCLLNSESRSTSDGIHAVGSSGDINDKIICGINHEKNEQLNFERLNSKVLQKKCSYLQKKLNEARKEIINLKMQVKCLKRSKNNKVVKKYALDILNSIFTPSQCKALLLGKRPFNWDKETIQLALTLRYISKKAYSYLKNRLGYPLPSVATLHRWASSIPVERGLLETVFSVMQSASHKLNTLEKLAVLQFDEMKIKSCYEYDKKKDEVIGPYQQMQVIQVRGLFSNWKQPVCVDFDTNVTKSLLLSVISRLYEIGYTVVACVSDMCSSNRGLWNSLCDDVYNQPFFLHPNDKGTNIYLFPDAPHLLKLTRNWILDTGFLLSDGTIVSKDVFTKLIQLHSNEYKACHKLTLHHVECEGSQRQNVRSAAQLLSHTTACAVKRYRPGNLSEQEADSVAGFIELVNSWFDIMNSFTPFNQVKQKCAYGKFLNDQNTVLNETQNVIGTLRCRGKNIVQIFQKGIVMSVNAVKGLFCELKSKYDVEYLLTHRLNQDSLENLFSQVRCKGGMYDHPTPLSALQRIKAIMLGKNPGILQEKNNSAVNLHVKEDHYLVGDVFQKADVDVQVKRQDVLAVEGKSPVGLESLSEMNPENNDVNSVNGFVDLTNRPTSVNVLNTEQTNKAASEKCRSEIEEDGMCYIAGWIAKKHKGLPHLGNQTVNMSHEHFYNKPSWVQQLSHGGLIQPSEEWVKMVKEMDEHFISFHGPTYIKKGTNCTRALTEELSLRYPAVEKKLVASFVRIRTFIRLNHLNRQLIKKRVRRSSNKVCKKMKKIVT